MSAHLAIQTAIVNALTDAPALAGGNVKANSGRPVSAGQSQAVVVRLQSSIAAAPQMLGGPYDWTTQFQVECLARAASAAADPAAAVDTLLADVWARLSTLNLAAQGVIDLRVQPRIQWDFDDADVPTVCASVIATVIHRTASTTLDAWT